MPDHLHQHGFTIVTAGQGHPARLRGKVYVVSTDHGHLPGTHYLRSTGRVGMSVGDDGWFDSVDDAQRAIQRWLEASDKAVEESPLAELLRHVVRCKSEAARKVIRCKRTIARSEKRTLPEGVSGLKAAKRNHAKWSGWATALRELMAGANTKGVST